MSEHSRFQDAFTAALAGEAGTLRPWLDADDRLAVYRNTIATGLADALADQFPSVARVVGTEWLAAAARAFNAAHRPASPCLVDYGAAFPDWLADFPPAAELPFLADLARIDWARREALFAPDAPRASIRAFAGLLPEDWDHTAADLHPSAQVLAFDHAVPSLWIALQAEEAPEEAELGAKPEALLLLRPDQALAWRRLTAGEHAFLAGCLAGESLAEAGAAALAAEPDLPLAESFAELIALGAFACVRRLPTSVS
jgi:hypothetical protein